LVARVKPALVHTHGYRADVIGGLVARACGLPAVSTVHGFTGGSRRNRLNERVQCIALRYADGIIAVSKPLVGRLSAAGVPKDRIHFVQNGFAPLSNALPRRQARQRLGIPDDRLVAAWIGRLSAEKGPDVALDALSQCETPWHLSMIGDGREGHRLRDQAASLGIVDRVTWHGPLPNAGTLLPAFDALILSSRTEGTPIVLFEAMEAQVPIVATRVGGVPDVLSSADAILVPPDTPHAIASGLDEIARDQKAANRRAAHSRQRLSESFEQRTWLARVSAVYDRVLVMRSHSKNGRDVRRRENDEFGSTTGNPWGIVDG
jgi:glycosyltransferase involved in cell wall biosynthesis